MGIFRTWFRDAEPEEQGSFCDTESNRTVINTDDSHKYYKEAQDRGDIIEDKSEQEFYTGRYNVNRTVDDSQGLPSQPKSDPGR